MRTATSFARFLATGITAMVVVQALFNISVVLGLMPTKGIPLPFISYGGSSLFITLATRRRAAQHHPASGISMRVILAGGGTGGHVIPALAIAQELRIRYDAEVMFVGTPRGIENATGAGGRISSCKLIEVGALNRVEPGHAAEDLSTCRAP